jgi:hypothetical protein
MISGITSTGLVAGAVLRVSVSEGRGASIGASGDVSLSGVMEGAVEEPGSWLRQI